VAPQPIPGNQSQTTQDIGGNSANLSQNRQQVTFGQDTSLATHESAQQQAEAHLTYVYMQDALGRLSHMPCNGTLVLISPGFSMMMDTTEM
jgi:hypothetical protein